MLSPPSNWEALPLAAMELSASIGGSLALPAAINPEMINKKCARGLRPQLRFSHRLPSSTCLTMFNKQCSKGTNHKVFRVLRAVSPVQCTENPTQTPVSFKDFHVSVCTEEDGVIKVDAHTSNCWQCNDRTVAMTDSIFEKVFSKHVAAAQPLPGFRRMEGGKTPDIPKEVALHLIGPSKVKKTTIKKIINCTVAEYVQKEDINASKNLKILQNYEELEAVFEPGKEFCFDAAVHLQ